MHTQQDYIDAKGPIDKLKDHIEAQEKEIKQTKRKLYDAKANYKLLLSILRHDSSLIDRAIEALRKCKKCRDKLELV